MDFFCEKFFRSLKFSGITDFNFRISGPHHLSCRIFLAQGIFIPKIFPVFNFHGKNFPGRKISRPKKVRVLAHRGHLSTAGFMTVT